MLWKNKHLKESAGVFPPSQLTMYLYYCFLLCQLLFSISCIPSLGRESWNEGNRDLRMEERDENFANQSYINFLGRKHLKHKWKAYNNHIDTLLTHGEWIDAWTTPNYRPMYGRMCMWEHPFLAKYIIQDCAVSLGALGYKFIWKPSSQALSPWSPESFCHLLQGRNILFVGDSMQEELFYIAASAMLAYTVIPHEHAFNETYIAKKRKYATDQCEHFCPYGIATCEGPVRIDCGLFPSFQMYFHRSDSLASVSPSGELLPWITHIHKHNISLLVLNTGAHFTKDAIVLQHLQTTLQTLYALYPELSVIYRSTPPGHFHCGETFLHPPMKSNNIMNNNFTEYMLQEHGKEEYHWHEFGGQNAAVKQMLQAQFPQVLWLNFETIMTLRADSHPLYNNDCLHYCSQSGLDEWMTLLMNALQLLSSSHSHNQDHSHSHSNSDIDLNSNNNSMVVDTVIGSFVYNEEERFKFLKNYNFHNNHEDRNHSSSFNASLSSSSSIPYHIDPHAQSYYSPFHISVVSFANQHTFYHRTRQGVNYNNKFFILINGTKRYVEDAWTRSVYVDDLRTPTLKSIDTWEFMTIPEKPPIKAANDFKLEDIPQ